MDHLTPKERSSLMSKIGAVSRMERNARRHATKVAGVRLRHQPKGLHGRPDYANKRKGVVVFVDGCFWHKCPRHWRPPKTNVAFWLRKVAMNAARRRKVAKALREAGYRVVRIWEHEVPWRDRMGKGRPA